MSDRLTHYRGIPIEELTREQLIAALQCVASMIKKQRDDHEQEQTFYRDCFRTLTRRR